MKKTVNYFNGEDDHRLYYRGWLPDNTPQTLLIIVHGLAEHSGRYEEIATYFATRGYAVFCHDSQGHGHSEGKKGYVERFSVYSRDLNTFIELVTAKYPDLPFFLLGHSLGATIAIVACAECVGKAKGLVLSATACQVGSSVSRLKIMLAKALSTFLPKLGVERLDNSTVSKDQEIVKAYRDDPLVYTGKLSARLGSETIEAMDNLIAMVTTLKMPVLMLHGGADRLADPQGSRNLYLNFGASDKSLKIYEDLYHEIMNEPERLTVLEDIEQWLKERRG